MLPCRCFPLSRFSGNRPVASYRVVSLAFVVDAHKHTGKSRRSITKTNTNIYRSTKVWLDEHHHPWRPEARRSWALCYHFIVGWVYLMGCMLYAVAAAAWHSRPMTQKLKVYLKCTIHPCMRPVHPPIISPSIHLCLVTHPMCCASRFLNSNQFPLHVPRAKEV